MENENKDAIESGWSNPPKLSQLKSDLEQARPIHSQQINKVDEWLKNLNIQRGDRANKKGRSQMCPKVIRRNNEWRYTSLSEPFLNTPQIFKGSPVTWEDQEAARQNTLVLNQQWNTVINKQKFIDRMIRKCVDEGTAIIRCGWTFKQKQVSKYEPVYEIRVTEIESQMAEIKKAAEMPADAVPYEILQALLMTQETGEPHYPVKVGEELIEDIETVANHPTYTICNMKNVIVDPTCDGDIDNAQFVIYSFDTSRAELEAEGLYENLNHINWDSNAIEAIADAEHENNWDGTGFNFSDDARKKIVAHEYWGFWDIDGSGETQPVVITWVGDTIIRMEKNPYPDEKIPFVFIPYLPVDGSVYGEPDGELINDQQEVVGALTRGMIDLMGRSANSQQGIRKGALDPLNRKRYEAGLDYEYNDFGDAQNSFHMHTYPEIPMSAYNLLQMQNQEAEALTGVKAFSQGVSGAGLGDTATHVRGALDAAARRELGILRRLADGVKQLGYKTVSMNQAFLEEKEVVRVTNDEFITVRRDDLSGKLDLQLDISTAEADEQKAAELSFMLQTTGQQMGVELFKSILGEIAELRRMPHLAHKIQQYQPEPDPIQQIELKKAELELAKIQLEMAKIQSETAKNMAAANKTNADADRTNLDFLEQESGVNHARDLEKLGQQAKANMQLKAFEKELNTDTKPQDNPQ